jgi:hypothetical protein
MRGERLRDYLRTLYMQGGLLKVKRAMGASHSGWEVRLSAASAAEARRIENGLKRLGLRSGRPFRKARRIVVPLYGESQVHLFFEEIRPEQMALFPTIASGRP